MDYDQNSNYRHNNIDCPLKHCERWDYKNLSV